MAVPASYEGLEPTLPPLDVLDPTIPYGQEPKVRVDVPTDDNGIVRPEHYFPYILGRPPERYSKKPDCDNNWQHMVFPTFMHTNRALAYHLYGEAGFTKEDHSKLAIYRGLPYNQVNMGFYLHVHYHNMHADHVYPPARIETVDQYLEDARLLTSLGAASIAKADLIQDGHYDSYHEELYEMHEEDQLLLIRQVGQIEVMPKLTVRSALKRMSNRIPDPILLSFSNAMNPEGSKVLPIRTESLDHLRRVAALRYRSPVEYTPQDAAMAA